MTFPILIINLNRRLDRWASFQQHIVSFIPFWTSLERLEAVDRPDDPKKGCLSSHMKAIQLAQKNNWEMVMVLEDDARLIQSIPPDLIHYLTQDTQWQVLFGASGIVRSKDFLVPTSAVDNSKSSIPGLIARPPDAILTGTHCMIYHRRGYQSIIQAIEQELQSDDAYHIDLMLCTRLNTQTGHILLSVPFLALFSNDGGSDVRKEKDTSQDLEQFTSAEKQAVRMVEWVMMTRRNKNLSNIK